jgi:hypothetical protein
MKKFIIFVIFTIVTNNAFAQSFNKEELQWLKMVNDDQAFAEFPGFRQIKEYQDYFGKMVKESKLTKEEIDFIGWWRIPEGILQEKKEGNLKEKKIAFIPSNGDGLLFFPDRTVIALWGHYDLFPLRAMIGIWKIENDILFVQVKQIIAVKLPLSYDQKIKKRVIKPDNFYEIKATQNWRPILAEVSSVYDKKLRYLYKPMQPILTIEEIKYNNFTNIEPIRESAFSQEYLFQRYYLKNEYIRLLHYLQGKTTVWDYIGSILGYKLVIDNF